MPDDDQIPPTPPGQVEMPVTTGKVLFRDAGLDAIPLAPRQTLLAPSQEDAFAGALRAAWGDEVFSRSKFALLWEREHANTTKRAYLASLKPGDIK